MKANCVWQIMTALNSLEFDVRGCHPNLYQPGMIGIKNP